MSPTILFLVSSSSRLYFECSCKSSLECCGYQGVEHGYGFDVKVLIAVRKKIIGLLKVSEAFVFPRSIMKSKINKQDDYMEGLADIPLEKEVMLPLKLKINYLSAV